MDRKKISFEYVKEACKAIDDKLGIDLTVLDISDESTIADYFVIAGAGNPSQLSAMADAVGENVFKNAGGRLHHAEGFSSKKWILLDFGDIIVHLFDKDTREFYNIEHTWGDAKKLDAEGIVKGTLKFEDVNGEG